MRRNTITRLATAAVAALTAALLIPAAPASADTLIVDATDPEFSASDNWGTSSWHSDKYGDHYRFADPYTGGSDAAWYEFTIPSAGNYNVDVWYPANSGYNNKAPYVINTSNGNQSVIVDQRYNGGQWVSLGTFSLDAGTYNAVGVSRWTNGTGYIIADAVRITTAGSAPEWALPLPHDALPGSEYDDPHHDYPAVDLPVWTGTPAYAIRAGTVDVINDSSCGRGINLYGDDGAVYTYCHFSSWNVSDGASVVAGQQIGVTGNTGNSTGPHLHFGVRTSGVLRCPQNMLLAIYDGVTPPAATSLPTSGCYY